MSDPNPENSFDRLLERLCIDALGEQEWQELAHKIAGDDEALCSYVEAVYWRQGLAYLVGRGADSDRMARSLVETAGTDEESGEPAPQATSEVDASVRSSAPRSTSDRLRTWFGGWAVAATVAFVAGAALTAVSLRRSLEPAPGNFAAPTQNPTLISSGQPAPFMQESRLGKVAGLSPDASADGLLQSLQVGQELRCGEVVQFTQGFMRVAFHAGSELIIEGPAEFSLVGKDSVFVHVGRVSAGGSEKLLLQSSSLMVECKGADVSFIAEEDRATDIYVYSGVVTMRSNARSDSASTELGMLYAGEGLRISPANTRGELSRIAINPPADAVRRWAEVEARLSPYENVVLSDRPLAYWPLYHVRRNRRVLDLTQHGYDGQAIGNWPVELDNAVADDERGAFFNGESYIEPDHKPPVDPRRGFTVEGWAKVQGGPAYQSIFTSRWVLDTFTPQRQCLGFTLYAGDNDRWQFWTGNGRYGELWKELHTDVPVARNRWTHVVATFDPEEPVDGKSVKTAMGEVRLYVDGKLVATDRHEMSLLDFDWPARIGAAEFVPNSLTAWLFRGSLRDIAIYDYPLELERILEHYKAGKPTTSLTADASLRRSWETL